MANIITTLRARMMNDRGTNKAFPCKTYKSEATAEKALEADATRVGAALDSEGKPAEYLVFFIVEWGVWTGAVNLREMMTRPTHMGGYVGVSDFYCF